MVYSSCIRRANARATSGQATRWQDRQARRVPDSMSPAQGVGVEMRRRGGSRTRAPAH
jgi:hypothetical protein